MFKELFAAFRGATQETLRASRTEKGKRAANTTKVLIALSIFLLVGVGVAPLHAEAVPYPENDPVFSVEVPDGSGDDRELCQGDERGIEFASENLEFYIRFALNKRLGFAMAS
jgi:hypothetical protein